MRFSRNGSEPGERVVESAPSQHHLHQQLNAKAGPRSTRTATPRDKPKGAW
jgi:hypothetical protein